MGIMAHRSFDKFTCGIAHYNTLYNFLAFFRLSVSDPGWHRIDNFCSVSAPKKRNSRTDTIKYHGMDKTEIFAQPS